MSLSPEAEGWKNSRPSPRRPLTPHHQPAELSPSPVTDGKLGLGEDGGQHWGLPPVTSPQLAQGTGNWRCESHQEASPPAQSGSLPQETPSPAQRAQAHQVLVVDMASG